VKVAKLSDAKNNLSRLVEHVRRGGRVRIMVRGIPAADLVPVAVDEAVPDDESWLASLEREGVVKRGRGGLPPGLLRPRRRPRGRALSRLVIEERRGGR
jgi:prevent-host-death family protein